MRIKYHTFRLTGATIKFIKAFVLFLGFLAAGCPKDSHSYDLPFEVDNAISSANDIILSANAALTGRDFPSYDFEISFPSRKFTALEQGVSYNRTQTQYYVGVCLRKIDILGRCSTFDANTSEVKLLRIPEYINRSLFSRNII